jgi:hypothetical protein
LIEEKSKQAADAVPPGNACFFPGDGEVIQLWLSRQPFGWRSRVDGKPPLTANELKPVLAKLQEWGWKDLEFTEAMRERREVILKDRTNVPGLLISLIRALPPRLSRRKSAPDRSRDARG